MASHTSPAYRQLSFWTRIFYTNDSRALPELHNTCASDYLIAEFWKKDSEKKQKVTFQGLMINVKNQLSLSKPFIVKSSILVILSTSQNVMMNKKLNFVSSSSLSRAVNAKMPTLSQRLPVWQDGWELTIARLPGFETWFCQLVTVQPCTSHFTFPSFHICKIGVPTFWGFVRPK